MKEQPEAINLVHPYNLEKAVEQFERGYLMNILQLSDWDKSKASEMLGIQIKILEHKMNKYKITV